MCLASSSSSPTRTVCGPVIVAASPMRSSSPIARKRSGSSSVSAIDRCTARTRSNTRAVSIRGSTGSIPSSPAVRMWWARLAEASSAFEGTQPVHRQSPPTRSRSTTQTLRSSVAANSAATMPPEPMPTMIRS